MNFSDQISYMTDQIRIENALPKMGKANIVKSIMRGLSERPKRISSMFFYDERGSELFEEITRLEEYYPTRVEKSLLRQYAPDLMEGVKGDIVELGSGDCSKVSILLNAVHPVHLDSIRYIPMDVSEEAIKKSADSLAKRYPAMSILGLVADFLNQLHLIPNDRERLFCFLGGTIGNLNAETRRSFFKAVSQVMNPGDSLVLGMDMAKPVDILEPAYNDTRGITAEFNRNILNVVNQLTGTNFNPGLFEHLAFFNSGHSRIEMHLRAISPMTVHSPRGETYIPIQKGERIHTENSYKFTTDLIERELAAACLDIRSLFQDLKKWFSLMVIGKKSDVSHA